MKLFEGIINKEVLLLNFEMMEYKKNQIIFHEKVGCEYFYYLVRGKITLLSHSTHGKKKIFFTIDEDDIINDFDLSFNNFPYEACVFENSQVLVIKQERLFELMQENSILFKNAMMLQAHRTRRLYRQLKNTTSLNIEKKLAAKLWKFSKDFGILQTNGFTLIDLKINNTYLADLIGCSRETISRSLQVLIKLELVQIINNQYYIAQDEILIYYRA